MVIIVIGILIIHWKMFSFWWNFHRWLRLKLSKWQLPVQPAMTISSKWWHFRFSFWHNLRQAQGSSYYSDVIMSTMASQINSLTIVYATVYSGTDQRKHQRSASLAFVWGIPHTDGQERVKCFHLMTSSYILSMQQLWNYLLWSTTKGRAYQILIINV